ncbi:MAG: 50S ribosomal protein L24 [Candidatus Buchananbacteria bacterium]|nr:50S ribosomal protein L24 [Candidatus Buchananbacteria bacterium]
MRIKKGDKVKVLSGKDQGKTGKVLQIFTKRGRLSVEGVNLMHKNMKPRRQGEKGQRIQFPAALPMSNVAIICPKCGKASRIGSTKVGEAKKARTCKKCKEAI